MDESVALAPVDDGLLDGPEQGLLFEAGAELLLVEENARRGRFSGAIIDKQRETVKKICYWLAHGFGVNKTAKAFGVSIHTVLGIRDRHPELVAMEERLLSHKLGRIQALGWERYEEALIRGEISAAQLPVGLGIAADKKALLDGKPTAIVEHREELSIDAINRLVDAMPAARTPDALSDGGGHNV